jgi:L-2-hydroxyglutarate oxidase
VAHLCNSIIYPVPIPNVDPLGPHFVRGVDGSVECGPNAVLAFAREGYSRKVVNFKYIWELLAFSGFWWLWAEHWPRGMSEIWRTSNKDAFVKTLQKLVPEIKNNQLIKAPSTVRAQAVTHEGKLIYDLIVQESHRIVHVLIPIRPRQPRLSISVKTIVQKLSKRLISSPTGRHGHNAPISIW